MSNILGGAVSGNAGDLDGGHQSQFVKEISKIILPGGSTYNIKDEVARNSVTSVKNTITTIETGINNGRQLDIISSINNSGKTQVDLTPNNFVEINLYNNLNIPIVINNPTIYDRVAEYYCLIRNNGGATFTFTFNIYDLDGDLCWLDDTYGVNGYPDEIDANMALFFHIRAIDGTFFAEVRKASLT